MQSAARPLERLTKLQHMLRTVLRASGAASIRRHFRQRGCKGRLHDGKQRRGKELERPTGRV